MRHLLFILVNLVIFQITAFSITAQDDEGVTPLGAHFSLESALETFKNSTTLKDFEDRINHQDENVHNLDLNEDNSIDYITVNSYYENDVHVITMSAVLDKDDFQDVAIIEIEKTNSDEAVLQIIGDESLYGENMIIEPSDISVSQNGNGPSAESITSIITLNVWLWPSVRYIYRPDYIVYRSSWNWNYYPTTWVTWHPMRLTRWTTNQRRYTIGFRVSPTRRVVRARTIYKPHRKTSKHVVVHKRSGVQKSKMATNKKANKKAKKKANKKVKKKANKKANKKAKKKTKKKAKVKSKKAARKKKGSN